jgi:hypothetical protein
VYKRPSWVWSYGSWSYNYLCNQCQSPLTVWVRIRLMTMCTWHNNYAMKFVTDLRRDYFNFPIVSFPFICSNIPGAPAYGVYIYQLIRYSRACGSYQDFLDRGLLLTRKLLNQGFLLVKLKSSLRKFYGRHHDLVDRYGISVSQMTTDMIHLS